MAEQSGQTTMPRSKAIHTRAMKAAGAIGVALWLLGCQAPGPHSVAGHASDGTCSAAELSSTADADYEVLAPTLGRQLGWGLSSGLTGFENRDREFGSSLVSYNRENSNCSLERFEAAGRTIAVTKYIRLSGDRQIRYRFSILGNQDREDWFIVLRTTEALTRLFHETQDLPSGARLFQLDGVRDEAVFNLGLFRNEPPYEVARAMVVDQVPKGSAGPAVRKDGKTLHVIVDPNAP